MRETYAKRLLVLAEYLERLPKERYDHDEVGVKTGCGTVCCAAGHAAVSGMFAGLKGEWIGTSLMLEAQAAGAYGWTVSAEVTFGPGTVRLLFDTIAPWALEWARNGRREPQKTAMVRAIRRFVDKQYRPEVQSLKAQGWSAEAKLREYFPTDRSIRVFLETGKRPVKIRQPVSQVMP